MRSILLKLVEQLLRRCSQNVVNFVDLVEFIVPWEERKQRQYFEEYAAHAPDVHLVAIMAISHQTFGSSIPACRYVFSERWLAIETSATTQICELNGVA